MAAVSVAHVAPSSFVLPTCDNFTTLVAELMADDDLTKLEATSQAVVLIDDLDAYAAVWNSWAQSFGNAAACPSINN